MKNLINYVMILSVDSPNGSEFSAVSRKAD